MKNRNVDWTIRKYIFKQNILPALLLISFILPGGIAMYFDYITQSEKTYLLLVFLYLFFAGVVLSFIMKAYKKGRSMVVAFSGFYLAYLLSRTISYLLYFL